MNHKNYMSARALSQVLFILFLLMACLVFEAPVWAQATNEQSSEITAASTVPQSPTRASVLAQSSTQWRPIWVASAGIVTVLGLMVVFKCNAFLALIAAALLVAVLSGIGGADPMSEVAKELGGTAGNIAILIVMAAVVGKCMLDSGSADTIVLAALKVTGENKAAYGLMGSGFFLAIPVFFDTVFYLLVPLARSLYQRLQKNYLLFVMAISCGGAVTHTLVPPTPGPLLVAATVGADVGMVMLVGLLVGVPTAICGMLFCFWANRRWNIPMRPVAGIKVDSPENDDEDLRGKHEKISRSVPFWLAILPVLLPLVMISTSTVVTTLADHENLAALTVNDLQNAPALLAAIRQQASEGAETPGARIIASKKLTQDQRNQLALQEVDAATLVNILNQVMLDAKLFNGPAFQSVAIDEGLRLTLAADHLRTRPVVMRRYNRQLLEATYPSLIQTHQWYSWRRTLADRLSGICNASVALGFSALIAIGTLIWTRQRSALALAGDIEEAVMSSGLIVLITSAGGAFGGMLQKSKINESIQTMIDLQDSSATSVLLLGFGIAALLKVAQGSSTVAMIVGSSMVAAMVRLDALPYHAAYLVTAIGGGSLVGSWMNDSGFWVYAKMGGLTESESLKTWTPMLAILGISAMTFTLLLSSILPLK